MRPAPVVSLCAVTALAVAGLVPAATAQPGSPTTDRSSGQTTASSPDVLPAAAARAQRTLASVEDAVSGDSTAHPADPAHPAATLSDGRDLTILLRDLRFQMPALRGEDRARAEAFLARPTDGVNDPYFDGYRVAAQDDCGPGEPGATSDFCIHWVQSTDDAPPLADSNPANGIPDQVDRTRATMQHVWDTEVGAAGYRPPLPDAGPPRKGPDDRFDVYLANIGDQLLYGYCASEPAPAAGNGEAAFCVLDDDYSRNEFPSNTPLENLQVTAAHEFFHAVQFGYDAREDVWMLEGTATWMEDEVYDAVDDNRFYLDDSPLTSPTRSLDRNSGLAVYGSWLWWRYLGEQHPADGGTGIPTIIRKIWQKADDSDASRPGTYSLDAVRKILGRTRTGLTASFAGFGVANRQPAASYEEGAAYGAAPLSGLTSLSTTTPKQAERVVRLDHFATRTYGYSPGAGLAQGRWKLRLRVDAPSSRHSPAVSVTSFRTDGTVSTARVALDRSGVGVATVGFRSNAVRRVELTLTNAGHNFRCNQGTTLSCRGLSSSDGRPFAYRARLMR